MILVSTLKLFSRLFSLQMLTRILLLLHPTQEFMEYVVQEDYPPSTTVLGICKLEQTSKSVFSSQVTHHMLYI